MDKVELEKIKFAFIQELSPHLLDAGVEFRENFFTDRVVMMVTGYIWGEKADQESIRYPADWWQAFKLRWFPERAIARWPIVYTVYDLTPMTLYPKFRISVPRETHVLKIDLHSRSEVARRA